MKCAGATGIRKHQKTAEQPASHFTSRCLPLLEWQQGVKKQDNRLIKQETSKLCSGKDPQLQHVAACCSMLQHESHHINSLRSLCHLLICIHNFHNWLRTFSSSSTRRASANSLSWQELCPMFPDVSRCFCLVYDEHSTILYEYTVVNSIVLSESTIPCESYSNICIIELS